VLHCPPRDTGASSSTRCELHQTCDDLSFSESIPYPITLARKSSGPGSSFSSVYFKTVPHVSSSLKLTRLPQARDYISSHCITASHHRRPGKAYFSWDAYPEVPCSSLHLPSTPGAPLGGACASSHAFGCLKSGVAHIPY
jgi:hypothetical protein